MATIYAFYDAYVNRDTGPHILTMAELLANPEKYLQQTVTVEGVIARVVSQGPWTVRLPDGQGGTRTMETWIVRATFADAGMIINIEVQDGGGLMPG